MTALRRPLIALALLAAATVAPAMSLREFRTLEAAGKEGPNYASYYLVGVVEGLRESAEATQRSGQKPPFCVAGRRLEPSMARSLFQGELARNGQLYEADMPVQLVLSAALQSAYRCSQ